MHKIRGYQTLPDTPRLLNAHRFLVLHTMRASFYYEIDVPFEEFKSDRLFFNNHFNPFGDCIVSNFNIGILNYNRFQAVATRERTFANFGH